MADFINKQADNKPISGAVNDAISNASAGNEIIKEPDHKIPRTARPHEAPASEKRDTTAYLADIARDRRVREAEDSSWLAKNIHHLLALVIMGLTFSLYTLVILGGSKDGFLKPETKDIVIYILGALTTVATQVVSYYFGSSSGSADKSRALNSIAKRG